MAYKTAEATFLAPECSPLGVGIYGGGMQRTPLQNYGYRHDTWNNLTFIARVWHLRGWYATYLIQYLGYQHGAKSDRDFITLRGWYPTDQDKYCRYQYDLKNTWKTHHPGEVFTRGDKRRTRHSTVTTGEVQNYPIIRAHRSGAVFTMYGM